MDLNFETTTMEQDRTLKHILEYLPEHLKEVLGGVLKEMEAKAINQGLVIDDCKRELFILKDTLKNIEYDICSSRDRLQGRSSTKPAKVIVQSTPTRKHESDDWFRGSVGDPFG